MSLWTPLRSHWPIKFGAIIVGVILWLHVKTDQTYERVVSLPLHVTETGRFVVANELPATVGVRIMGTGKDLLFRKHHGRVVVKPRVSGREPITVDLSTDQIEGIDEASGFAVVEIVSPQSILLDFDYFDTREVPVVPRVGIKPRPGYTVVGRVTSEPRGVRVSGPRRYVREVESLPTDSLVVTDVAGPVEQVVGFEMPESRNLAATPDQVTVRAKVQVLLERRFADVPVVLTHVPRGVRVQVVPERVTVDVIGGDEVVGAMSDESVTVELDYRQRFRKGLDDLALTATLPEHVRLVRMDPTSASIIVGRTASRRR